MDHRIILNIVLCAASALLAIYIFVNAVAKGTLRLAPEILLIIAILFIFVYNLKRVLIKFYKY